MPIKDLSMLKYEHQGKVLLKKDDLKKAAQKLKPCPFCGEAAELIASNPLPEVHNGFKFTSTCMNPACCGRNSKTWPTMNVAVFKWNMRIEKPQEETKMPEEPEFTREQLDQIDRVDNAAHQLICALCKEEDLPWNIEYIGEIADMAQTILKGKGISTFYPAITVDIDGEKIVEE